MKNKTIKKKLSKKKLSKKITEDREEISLKKSWGKNYDAKLAVAKLAAQHFRLTSSSINAIESLIGYKNTLEIIWILGQHLERHLDGFVHKYQK